MGKMGFIQENYISKTVEQDSIIVPKDFRHSMCTGATGSGKTSSYMYPNINDRIENGYGVFLIDYKGIEHQSIKYFAHKNNRLQDVIEIGVPWGEKVNLIKYMNEKELKNLVVSIMSLNGDNDYWSTSGANLIAAIWKSMKAYQDILNEATLLRNRKNILDIIGNFRLPITLTFSDIADVCKSIDSIATFLIKVEKLFAQLEKFITNKVYQWSKKYEVNRVANRYLDIMTSLLSFKYIVSNELQSLAVFRDSLKEPNKSTSFQTLVLAMSSTFSSISDNKTFNCDNGIDIVKALNSGKVIVLNSQQVPNIILSKLIESILQELTKRVRSDNNNPISFFIDESQRVISGIDLHEEVLRASKVELFLAYQNVHLMINILGKSQYFALAQNLSTSFHFTNPINFEELDTKKLEIFEYYKNDNHKVCKATPIFLNKQEVFDIELEYFHLNDIYDKLNINMHDRDKVIQFQPYLFEKNMIELKGKDGVISVIKLKDKQKQQEALSFINSLIDTHKVSLNRRKTKIKVSGLFDKRIDKIDEFMNVSDKD